MVKKRLCDVYTPIVLISNSISNAKIHDLKSCLDFSHFLDQKVSQLFLIFDENQNFPAEKECTQETYQIHAGN